MIDIHAHILAGIDDGPKTWEDSLKLAELAVQSGIKTMVATPHYQYGDDLNNQEKVIAAVKYFQGLLDERGIPLQVLPGGEVMISAYYGSFTKCKDFPTLNGTGKYVLIELPVDLIPGNINEVIFNFRVKGITPIIAHPERNLQVIKNPNIMLKLIEYGALSQVNACSLVGKQGRRVMRTAEVLLVHKMAHFLASDSHGIRTRIPWLGQAKNKLEKFLGAQIAKRIIYEHPKAVLNGENFRVEEPEKYNKRFDFLYYPKIMILQWFK